MSDVPESITVTEGGFDLPVADVLTGRGFVTGKSGSGKSNTASVIAEELLEHGLPLMIIDTDGEYYGLQDRYQVLHAAVDGTGDIDVGPDDAERLAGLALDGNVPIVLDISGYMDLADGRVLVERVLREVFRMEDARRKPFLVIVEEIHEYLPERGGHGDLGELLIQIAKRGRKRGLGLCGISQRPAAVSKDFITQCDWLVWHRLTWENDIQVVRKLLGSDAASTIQDLGNGEAYLMTDWDDSIRRVQFKRKQTLDAGATPDVSDVVGGPEQTLEPEVLEALAVEPATDESEVLEPVEAPDPRDRRIAQLEATVAELEAELDRATRQPQSEPDSAPTPAPTGGFVTTGLSEIASLATYLVSSTAAWVRRMHRSVIESIRQREV